MKRNFEESGTEKFWRDFGVRSLFWLLFKLFIFVAFWEKWMPFYHFKILKLFFHIVTLKIFLNFMWERTVFYPT